MSETWLSDHQLRNKKLGGCSRSSLNRYRKDPNFPEPRRYAGRNLTPESEIDLYLEQEFAETVVAQGTGDAQSPRPFCRTHA